MLDVTHPMGLLYSKTMSLYYVKPRSFMRLQLCEESVTINSSFPIYFVMDIGPVSQLCLMGTAISAPEPTHGFCELSGMLGRERAWWLGCPAM
jgi:hypothetical protein